MNLLVKFLFVIRKIVLLVMLIVLASGTIACSELGGYNVSSDKAMTESRSEIELNDLVVFHDAEFGGIYLKIGVEEFNDVGFVFGDSVDIRFSNGYSLEDIPYFSGYFVSSGNKLLIGYYDYPYIKVCVNHGGDLWDESGLQNEEEHATVVLREAGKYLEVQKTMTSSYTNERKDYASDEIFANYRQLSGGSIAEGVIYRSASPVDDEYNRAGYVNLLMKTDEIGFMLNLSDSKTEMESFLKTNHERGTNVSFFEKLYKEGKFTALNMNANYWSDTFALKLAKGLSEMAENDGPYLVHCVEGKDRTGFVCVLLEALAGASYDEIANDYMKSYENYYGIDAEGEPEKYDTFRKLKLNPMICYIAGIDNNDDPANTEMDLHQSARNYLGKARMSSEAIDRLEGRLRGE